MLYTLSMKTRILSISILLILGVLLFSWAANSAKTAGQTDVNVDALRTEAVSTFASSLTKTLEAVPTTIPTLTVAPTFTLPAITETPAPSATSNPCYNLLWIEDVTIPDGTQMKAGEVFTKTWLVQNIGGCAWRAGFTFAHVGGDLMRGNPIVLEESIQTGAKRELSLQLTVPSGQSGLIQSSWRMADENGVFFGDTLSVNITVGEAGTPAATNTP
jgi:hypothetical protein